MKLGEYTAQRTPYIVAAALDNVDLTLAGAQRRHVEYVLKLVDGRVPLAARLLGVSRRLLERWGYHSTG